MIVRSRAPLRLGLAGGGTDVSPFCDTYGGCVLNAAIDKYAWTTVQENTDGLIEFVSTDTRNSERLLLTDNFPLEGPLKLHRAVYKHIIQEFNCGVPIPLTVTTSCEVPQGSGLGGSSTIVVSMIKAFVEYLNIPLDDYSIANLAIDIERRQCGLKGGKQDQFSAAFGGVNYIEFQQNGQIIVNSLRIKNWILCELEASILLYFTGVSRESAKVIETQSNNMILGKADVVAALQELKEDAYLMKQYLLQGDFKSLVGSIGKAWESKKKTSSAISNNKIDEIFEVAFKEGALAGKVSGAGGGGFAWFFVDPNKKVDLSRKLLEFGGEVSGCHFTKKGAEAWRIL